MGIQDCLSEACEKADIVVGMTVATGTAGTSVIWDDVNGILTVPRGDDGTSAPLTPKGTDTAANILLKTPTLGDFWTASDTSIAYVGDGASWINMGDFTGADGAAGADGDDGDTIDHITRTVGDGSEGTTDTYTVYGDVAETNILGTFDVYNGADGTDGAGSGDMEAADYDTGTWDTVHSVDSARTVLGKTVLENVPSGAVFTDTTYTSSDFTHDNLTGFVANEHIDWTSSGAGTIHATNYTNTTYVSSDFTHDDLTGFVANEHIDWTSASAGTIHADNYTNTTYDNTDFIDLTSAQTAFGLKYFATSVKSKNFINITYAVTGTTPLLSASNGNLQTWTLSGNSIPTTDLADGEELVIMIDDGTAYTVTWTSVVDTWIGGSAPTLPTSGYGVIVLWCEGTTVYGKSVGDA